MQQIINFILRNKTFLLFLLLLFISLSLTIQSHSYHKSKFVHSANFLSGGLYNSANNISEYFNLRKENDILIEENNKLRNQLYNETSSEEKKISDSTFKHNQYIFTSAHVIKNSYSNTNNYLLINKGRTDSIKQDLGVISSKGLIGIVDKTSNGYARVISILNTNTRINAKLKKTDHYGSLRWDAKSPEFVQLVDVPKIAPIQKGDTITTGGRSFIFPKGIEVGTIESFTLDDAEDYYEIQVKLFNDMTNIGYVYIVKNQDREELLNLDNTNE